MKTERKRGKIFIVITVVAAFAVLVGFFSNTVAFERMMGKIVERYVSDNNYELASHISYRLKTGQEFIKDLADSLSRMPEFLMTEDLLSRKEEATELDGICVVSRENGFSPRRRRPRSWRRGFPLIRRPGRSRRFPISRIS